MPDILEFAEKNKEHTMKALRELDMGGDDMKSNNVRMKLNRNLHAHFKRVSGETNDERMSKLLDDSDEKYALIWHLEEVLKSAKEVRAVNQSKNATIKTLASALVVSIAVSVACVGYVCVVNGWFA